MSLLRFRPTPSLATLRPEFAHNLDALFLADETLINGRVSSRAMLPWPRTTSYQGPGSVMRGAYTKHPVDAANIKFTIAGLATHRNSSRFYTRELATGGNWSLTIRYGVLAGFVFSGANYSIATANAAAEGATFAYVWSFDGTTMRLDSSYSPTVSLAAPGYQAAGDVDLGRVQGQPDSFDSDTVTLYHHLFYRQLDCWSPGQRAQFIADPWSMFVQPRFRRVGPGVLSSPTYVPGSLTATTVKPRVTVNFP